MPQNIYDDPVFFSGYNQLRTNKLSLNDALERPALLSILPKVQDLDILELGCGDGALCRLLADRGARSVVGMDVSERMLTLAHQQPQPEVNYIQSAIEEFDTTPQSVDLIISELVLHYIADLRATFENIAGWLRPDGVFVFSVEHPITTAAQGIHPGWIKSEEGHKLFWPVDCYQDEGLRTSHWLVDGVEKYHRTSASILNGLISAGLQLEYVAEPSPLPEALAQQSNLEDELRRPPVLLVRARKSA